MYQPKCCFNEHNVEFLLELLSVMTQRSKLGLLAIGRICVIQPFNQKSNQIVTYTKTMNYKRL